MFDQCTDHPSPFSALWLDSVYMGLPYRASMPKNLPSIRSNLFRQNLAGFGVRRTTGRKSRNRQSYICIIYHSQHSAGFGVRRTTGRKSQNLQSNNLSQRLAGFGVRRTTVWGVKPKITSIINPFSAFGWTWCTFQKLDMLPYSPIPHLPHKALCWSWFPWDLREF